MSKSYLEPFPEIFRLKNICSFIFSQRKTKNCFGKLSRSSGSKPVLEYKKYSDKARNVARNLKQTKKFKYRLNNNMIFRSKKKSEKRRRARSTSSSSSNSSDSSESSAHSSRSEKKRMKLQRQLKQVEAALRMKKTKTRRK